jgi:hypothetical protein
MSNQKAHLANAECIYRRLLWSIMGLLGLRCLKVVLHGGSNTKPSRCYLLFRNCNNALVLEQTVNTRATRRCVGTHPILCGLGDQKRGHRIRHDSVQFQSGKRALSPCVVRVDLCRGRSHTEPRSTSTGNESLVLHTTTTTSMNLPVDTQSRETAASAWSRASALKASPLEQPPRQPHRTPHNSVH